MPFSEFDDRPDVQTLQAEQDKALDAYYAAQGEERKERLKDYEATVTKLVALLGEDAFCPYVDTELYSSYSDYYKEVLGFRPRHHVTRQDCKDFFAQHGVEA